MSFSCTYKSHKLCSTLVKCSWCAECQSVSYSCCADLLSGSVLHALLHVLLFLSLVTARALDFLSFLDDVVGFTGDLIVWHNPKHDSHTDTLRLCSRSWSYLTTGVPAGTWMIILNSRQLIFSLLSQTFRPSALFMISWFQRWRLISGHFYPFCLRNQLIYDKSNHLRHTCEYL